MNHYIGYSSVEKFLDYTPPYHDIYATLITEPGASGQHGVRSDKLVITLQRLKDDQVHYCRIPVGSLTYIGESQPFDPNAQERKDRALQAFDLVQTWLVKAHYNLIPATVAVPLDHRFLDGWADFLGYTKERGFFLEEQ